MEAETKVHDPEGSITFDTNLDAMSEILDQSQKAPLKGHHGSRSGDFRNDMAHQCGSHLKGEEEEDEYDCVIDFESRRQSLRKGFERQLDHLYLMEQIETRRRGQKEKKKEAGLDRNPDTKEDLPPQTAEKPFVPVPMPEPQINRMNWYLFRRLAVTKTRAGMVDILMGEPSIQDSMHLHGTWYCYSGLPPRKTKKVQRSVSLTARNPEVPLPERIRIHSGTLLKIMAKILGSDGGPLENMDDTPVVFLRPFKALVYCEEQLREGCAVLEKRFTAASDTLVQDLTEGMDPNASQSEVKDTNLDLGGKEPPSASKSKIGEKDDVNEETKEPDEDTNSVTALKHLRCLLQFLDEDIKPKRAYLEQPQCRKVFFSDLWYLFRPGMEVIGNDGKQAYRVIQVKSARHRVVPEWEQFRESSDYQGKRPQAPFSLSCVYIDFDGKNLGPVSKLFDFERFEGQKDITSLEVYPLKMHSVKRADFGDEEWEKVEGLSPRDRNDRYRQKLIGRGQMFLAVAGIKHMFYAGPTLGVRDEVESQVVIDFETAFAVDDEEQQHWKPKLELLVDCSASEGENEDEGCRAGCCQSDQIYDDSYVDNKQRTEYIGSLLPKNEHEETKSLLAIIPRPLKDLRSGPNKALEISQDELVIMSYRVFGFVLRTRKWAKLDLSYLKDVHQLEAQAVDGEQPKSGENKTDSVTPFERLVLEKQHKEMIMSLVSQHFRDEASTANQKAQPDIVRGKGKGLIFLLHGEPGVGKTTTAEGVAELFQKPLFQITCGDLGTTAKEVEKALETTFALANRWGCILLLDEADVFLAQRTKEDFQRNGLVDVFLRVMEYYTGILFLTTNRVEGLDEAFTSRIHLSLYYPALNLDKTVNVFKLNLELIRERFRKKGRVIKINEFDIGHFASKHFTSHSNARWNGRQIRNECRTALALAEFEAQGNSHTAVENPDAAVTLSVSHFETVRNAYINFTKYMDKLYRTKASTREQEEKLRTAGFNHSDHRFATQGVDQKAHFARMARGQPPANSQYPPSQHSNRDVPPMNYARVQSKPQSH
ncbi:hypothetical protein BDV28DRAFT_127797 [Aspergillus coremiiformis]|uniref:AAA+ ATPase domain-containing protein n=1 Tax=Aspergillus coremiiformis TaxID=138285 RepID=A0A5N6ZEC7_9EURO|nr:hypothetical protein BDV28DRAFT_127797 [Aspergillus coremiiformis]